jgi:hypothetical protein
VVELERQVEQLRATPEMIRMHLPAGRPIPSLTKHLQGIVRVDTRTSRASLSPSFYLSLSRGGEDGKVLVGEVSSARDGEMLRSNVASASSRPWEVAWPETDRVTGDVSTPNFAHAGGIQAVGDVLLVSFEDARGGSLTGGIGLYDLSNPGLPTLVRTLEAERKIGVASGVRISPSEYIVAGHTATDPISAYVVTGDLKTGEARRLPDVPSPWLDASGRPITSTKAGPQHVSLLRDCAGGIYALATRNPTAAPLIGDNLIDLYRVTVFRNPDGTVSGLSYAPVRLALGRTCSLRIPFAAEACNFAAAGGTYVTPSGALILYGAPHENWFGYLSLKRSITVAQFTSSRGYATPAPSPAPAHWKSPFAPRIDGPDDARATYTVAEGTRAGLPSDPTVRPPAARVWMELFEGKNFSGRSMVIFAQDVTGVSNLTNVGLVSRARSVRWWIAPGCKPEFFYLPGFLVSVNAGSVGQQAAIGGRSIGEIAETNLPVTGARFVGPCDRGVQSGWFNPATKRAATTIDATGLDGPTTTSIGYRATAPLGRDSIMFPVTVRNVPPQIISVRAYPSPPRIEVTVEDVPTDPVTVSGTIETFDDRASDDKVRTFTPVNLPGGRQTAVFSAPEVRDGRAVVRITVKDDEEAVNGFARDVRLLLAKEAVQGKSNLARRPALNGGGSLRYITRPGPG